MFYQLIYLSTTSRQLSDKELEEILETSRLNNEKLGVTGLLIIRGRTFMQALEGEKEIVLDLYRKIEQDDRHLGVILINEREVAQREFPDWSMGFKNLDRLPTVESRKINDLTHVDVSKVDFTRNPSIVSMLFKGFVSKS